MPRRTERGEQRELCGDCCTINVTVGNQSSSAHWKLVALVVVPCRTLNLVSEQQGKLEKMLSEKQKQLEVLVATLNQKVLEKQASAQAAAAADQSTAA